MIKEEQLEDHAIMEEVDPNQINIDHNIFESLINEGKHMKVLNATRPTVNYNEKELREAAHAVVAQTSQMFDENGEGGQFPDEMDGKSRKRKCLNPDEKASVSRDRNREHAKLTRLRKKAYVLKLKELVEEMNKQKETEENERKTKGVKILETQIIRKNVVRTMLNYRALNVKEHEKWGTILDEKIVLTLPITPYRSFFKGNIKNSNLVIHGIDAVIADTASLALMAESIGQDTPQWKESMKRGRGCHLSYVMAKDDILAAGDFLMCKYVMQISGYEEVGGLSSCVQVGMMQCHFDRYNKIIAAEMIFDVMCYMQQLQRASEISPECSIIPNSLDMALQPSREAQAILEARYPYTVLHVNDAWTALNSHSQSEAEGSPMMKVLLAYEFQQEMLHKLASDCSRGHPGSRLFLAKSPAVFYLKLLPLSDNQNKRTHLLASIIHIPLTIEETELLLSNKKILSDGSENGADYSSTAERGFSPSTTLLGATHSSAAPSPPNAPIGTIGTVGAVPFNGVSVAPISAAPPPQQGRVPSLASPHTNSVSGNLRATAEPSYSHLSNLTLIQQQQQLQQQLQNHQQEQNDRNNNSM